MAFRRPMKIHFDGQCPQLKSLDYLVVLSFLVVYFFFLCVHVAFINGIVSAVLLFLSFSFV